ncbi:hypothetical protein Dsin_030055 [Dipteronia sinensis]|uniref:Uncharacterized protein n=1 Tax=Dipteronia sinensis TaxID=43782 RepID=A0AAD9ZK64_9ROSI|nr:hypothetical protein Dsin_030055 [Dipteronia sinensis]
MAMMQWCGVVARRVLATTPLPSLTLPALTSAAASNAPILCGRGDKEREEIQSSHES